MTIFQRLSKPLPTELGFRPTLRRLGMRIIALVLIPIVVLGTTLLLAVMSSRILVLLLGFTLILVSALTALTPLKYRPRANDTGVGHDENARWAAAWADSEYRAAIEASGRPVVYRLLYNFRQHRLPRVLILCGFFLIFGSILSAVFDELLTGLFGQETLWDDWWWILALPASLFFGNIVATSMRLDKFLEDEEQQVRKHLAE